MGEGENTRTRAIPERFCGGDSLRRAGCSPEDVDHRVAGSIRAPYQKDLS